MEDELQMIKTRENYIRDNLYNIDLKDDVMNKDNFYDLIEITEDVWKDICISIINIKDMEDLYFSDARRKIKTSITKSWEEIKEDAKKNKIEKYFGKNKDKVFLAGGAALSVLLNIRCNDYDYFTTTEIKPWEIKTDYLNVNKKTITFGRDKKVQLIKRLYKIPHEIVHSFDIDCCSVLITHDGRIYGSNRFLYSIKNGYNTVDFEYFSPSYEWRLMKYATRGFGINIPGVSNCVQNGKYCISDTMWESADINDFLEGSMLRSLLINAKGIEKILIGSSVWKTKSKYVLVDVINSQNSDYSENDTYKNDMKGLLKIGESVYQINGKIGYDSEGPSSYMGLFLKVDLEKEKDEEEDKTKRSKTFFSEKMESLLLSILNSDYKKVNPGEQTTSTFHKLVLDDPREWFIIDKESLIYNSLIKFLYFRQPSLVPSFYDEKIEWFGTICKNYIVYHIARLVLNGKMYDKFANFEIIGIKVSSHDIRPEKIIFKDDDGKHVEIFKLKDGSTNDILKTWIKIGKKYKIFDRNELRLMKGLNIRDYKTIPTIEKRNVS